MIGKVEAEGDEHLMRKVDVAGSGTGADLRPQTIALVGHMHVEGVQERFLLATIGLGALIHDDCDEAVFPDRLGDIEVVAVDVPDESTTTIQPVVCLYGVRCFGDYLRSTALAPCSKSHKCSSQLARYLISDSDALAGWRRGRLRALLLLKADVDSNLRMSEQLADFHREPHGQLRREARSVAHARGEDIRVFVRNLGPRLDRVEKVEMGVCAVLSDELALSLLLRLAHRMHLREAGIVVGLATSFVTLRNDLRTQIVISALFLPLWRHGALCPFIRTIMFAFLGGQIHSMIFVQSLLGLAIPELDGALLVGKYTSEVLGGIVSRNVGSCMDSAQRNRLIALPDTALGAATVSALHLLHIATSKKTVHTS